MHGAGQSGIIQEWKRLAEQEPDSRWRSDLGALVLLFAGLAGRATIWQEELRGWNVKQSQVVLEWQAEARIETTQANLLRLLRKYSPAGVPPDLEAAITMMNDAETLNRWFDAAVDVSSLAAFRRAIGR